MIDYKKLEVWFVTGSQHLYGEEVLKEIAGNAKKIVEGLSQSEELPVKLVYKPVLTTSSEIKKLSLEANSCENCIGIITWMHTFSPARMWIKGLQALDKPILHLHTQYNKKIPWSKIDMNYMNTNQSAHGDREYGYMLTRMKKQRKVLVGYWQDEELQQEMSVWMRAAAAWHDAQEEKIARFGDNMRQVAVTEGDKVEAEIKLGYAVNGYGIGDLVEYVNRAGVSDINSLVEEYREQYKVKENINLDSLREAARIELGLRAFLEEGDFSGFTTTFEDLHGLKQLPGLAVQRLMADGYGFGAEGDWKTAALVRAMKVMGAGLPGGTSFMEQYTYNLEKDNMMVLGAHMLEVCESIAEGKPSLEVHPLSIGGKADPARLVFDTAPGSAINASVIDLGDRFRMIVNDVSVVKPVEPLPELPVARTVWQPEPDFKTAIKAWILAGGAHHTGFSQAVDARYMNDFASMAGIEFLHINQETRPEDFKKELQWNEVYYKLR